FILNTTSAPTDDLRIRTAMAHAIDRGLLIETFRSDLTIEANTFIEPNSPWFSPTEYPGFDPETGAGLVAQYEAEVGPAEVTLTVSNTPSTIEVAEVVASFWDAIGIDTTVDAIAPGTEVTPVIGDDFQAIYWFQFASPDPDVDYVFFHSSAGPINWSNLVDPDIDGGFDQARASADPTVRAEGYAQVQDAIVAQLPMLWIDHLGGVDVAVSRPEVQGYQDSTFPDGTPTVGLYNGSYFTWQSVWRAS
ncbi:MAG: ABC transporter substrate-binding protein, partial [Ilumatobacteraceae bacterium]